MSPPRPAAPPLALADFGDWLPPIIVKELRQGLRTWVFVGALILLQLVLLVVLVVSFQSKDVRRSTEIFWVVIAVIIVFLIPLRGGNALAGEMKANTLDLLQLTRLGSFRIAFGKWTALFAQATLITISAVPYVILRYLAGAVDLAHELITLILLWMLSGFVTALAVMISAHASVILRGLLILGTGVLAVALSDEIIESVKYARPWPSIFNISASPGREVPTGLLLAAVAAIWAFACYFILDMGATVLAATDANHATRKRLIALGFALAALLIIVLLPAHPVFELGFMCFFYTLALAGLDALTESPTGVPTIYAPFARKAALGWIGAYALAPGWPTGLVFYGLTVGLFCLGIAHVFPIPLSEMPMLMPIFFTPLVPLALALLIFRRSTRILVPFLVCSLAVAAWTVLLVGLSESDISFDFVTDDWDLATTLGLLTPPSFLMVSGPRYWSRGEGIDEDVHRIGIALWLPYLAYVVWRAVPHYRAIHRALREAAAHNATDQP